MYRKIMNDAEEIRNNPSYMKPQDLANTAADLLSDGELTTGEYLALMEVIGELLTLED